MAKGIDRTYGMALSVALLLTLSVWMVPAAEALPSYLTAPWTPLSGPNGNDGVFHTAPWSPLSVPNGTDGSVHTAPWSPLSVQEGNEGVVMPQTDTGFETLVAPTPGTAVAPTPGTVESLLASDIAAAIVPSGPYSAPASSIPEPATVILLGIGILALMLIGWRRADSLRR